MEQVDINITFNGRLNNPQLQGKRGSGEDDLERKAG